MIWRRVFIKMTRVMSLERGKIFPYVVALYPLFFPLYFLKGNLFGIPVTVPELILIALGLYFIVREEAFRKSFWVTLLGRLPGFGILVFLIAAVISTLIVPELNHFADGTIFAAQDRALGILKGWIFMPFAYFLMFRYYCFQKPRLFEIALRALLITGLGLSIYGIVQFITGTTITLDGRVSGPFVSANYLALYLGPILLYGLVRSFEKQTAYQSRIIFIVSSVICGLALLLTDSYAAWGAVLCTLLAWFVLHPKKHWQVSMKWVIPLGVIVVVAALASQLGTEKFASFLELGDRSSSSVRMQVYEVSFGLLKQFPVLGHGLGQYEVLYQQWAPEILGEAPFEWVMIHPHNVFLATWLNMGLLGLIGFVALLWKAFSWLTEVDSKGRSVAAFMLLSLILHGLFDTPIYKNDLAFQFWLLLAILI